MFTTILHTDLFQFSRSMVEDINFFVQKVKKEKEKVKCHSKPERWQAV